MSVALAAAPIESTLQQLHLSNPLQLSSSASINVPTVTSLVWRVLRSWPSVCSVCLWSFLSILSVSGPSILLGSPLQGNVASHVVAACTVSVGEMYVL
ncbi:hypothetical protein NEOLEDRAFT_276840 [Neolentinus lepideus HHB14362 ss-1]|uniref:Uncharacterized protein n=1 Tax=Neolentinus lepideus HHB14362 ss-1 TaxID=1314782 RepID=A0A165SXF9_9AGAM|nr:hypothetical protein NEOLEDRAFT_276840 [Neolentinus lepideus HHB14362 ss-1]